MAKVVVLGAGPMGLAAAWQAARDGHQVQVVEAGPIPGGMAAHFDFGGLSLERFYHFICKADESTFAMLRDLGIADRLRWVPTTMGYYIAGKLQRWGDPVALLRLRGLSFATKLRYGAFVFTCTHRNNGESLENVSARDWLRGWCGKEGYAKLWKPLMDYKFYDHVDHISARWIWTRIRRLGRSRKNLMQEELGYLEGGSETLVGELVRQIEQMGGSIHYSCPVQRVLSDEGNVTGVQTVNGTLAADAVLSTIPVQQIPNIAPQLPTEWLHKYASIANIGICCVVLKLRRPVSEHFWVNIKDEEHQIPGIIEFSNLRPLEHSIVYVPYYLPVTHPKFSWTDEQFLADTMSCIAELNPAVSREDVLDARVFRLRYAQPICDVGFASKLPPVQTPIAGLQIADTCFYYPEDRGISESVRLGRAMARAVRPQGAA